MYQNLSNVIIDINKLWDKWEVSFEFWRSTSSQIDINKLLSYLSPTSTPFLFLHRILPQPRFFFFLAFFPNPSYFFFLSLPLMKIQDISSMNNDGLMKKTDQEIEEERERENVSEAVNEFSRSSITLDIIIGDTKQEIDSEKTRRENVSETDKECESQGDRLALTLRPPGYSPCQDSPVKEPSPRSWPRSWSWPRPLFQTPPTQFLPTTSPPLFIPDLFPSEPARQRTNPYPSESLTPAESIPPPPPLPLPTGQTSRQSRSRPLVWPNGKTEVIPAPYVWATTRRATVHRLDYLVSRQISIISGQVQCKRCERSFEMQYDLLEKFNEIGSFIAQNKILMRDRAPDNWKSPTLPNCTYCGAENSVKPCISAKKRSINWLFLLLGQMIGCCTLEQLKYFCKHTKNHRTACKDRVLYLTYLDLCKQLDPSGPFSLRWEIHQQPLYTITSIFFFFFSSFHL